MRRFSARPRRGRPDSPAPVCRIEGRDSDRSRIIGHWFRPAEEEDVAPSPENGGQGGGRRRGRGVRPDPAPDVETRAPGGRIRELDSLRGLACLAIVIYHAMPHKVPGGWAAVDLSFIVSG